MSEYHPHSFQTAFGYRVFASPQHEPLGSALLPAVRLTLLVGMHAQGAYLPGLAKVTMTETVRGFAALGPDRFPLPHPSWRSTGWMGRNPWFEQDVLPPLRRAVQAALAG